MNSKDIKAGDKVRFILDVHEYDSGPELDGRILVNKGQTGVVHEAPYDEYLVVNIDQPNGTGCGGVGCYCSDVEKI